MVQLDKTLYLLVFIRLGQGFKSRVGDQARKANRSWFKRLNQLDCLVEPPIQILN